MKTQCHLFILKSVNLPHKKRVVFDLMVLRKTYFMITHFNNILKPSSFQHLFSDFLELDNYAFRPKLDSGFPLMNIHEQDDCFLVEVIAPGYEKQNFTVIVENDMMMIEAKVEYKEKALDLRVIRHDYSVANFKKVIHLDRKMIGEPKEGTYVNGVLKIMLPKLKKESTLPNHVQIH